MDHVIMKRDSQASEAPTPPHRDSQDMRRYSAGWHEMFSAKRKSSDSSKSNSSHGWQQFFQLKKIEFDPLQSGIPQSIIHLLMKIIMDHDFTVDSNHEVIWIEREEDHPAWHEVFSGPLLESLRRTSPYWYNILYQALHSHQNIAKTLLNALNLPPGYYQVTSYGLFQIVVHPGPEYV